MAVARGDSPLDWYGVRTVIPMERKCGFCADKRCAGCPHEIAWYEKLWICGCECNLNYVPQKVVVERVLR